MPELRKSVTVGSSGTAVIPFQHYKTGIQWIVSQISNSTQPFRVGSTVTVDRNGTFITNTPLASGDSAAGPPYYLLNASDVLNFTFAGMTAGDQCSASIFYTEGDWSPNPVGGIVV